MSKNYSYSFTWNNYPDNHEELLLSQNYTYLIFGYEIAPTTNTKHLQGYIRYKSQKTITSIIKLLKGIHLEKSNGNPAQNREYCIKDGNYKEYGEMPKQGQRTDITSIASVIKETPSIRKLLKQGYLNNQQQLKYAETLLKYVENPIHEKPTVKWYYNKTGTGKTKAASEECPHAYWTWSGRWWDGYDGHEEIIIDDIRRETYSFNFMLRLLNKYGITLKVKDGSKACQAKIIIITCPYHPKELYSHHLEDIQQLLRRIDIIKKFT